MVTNEYAAFADKWLPFNVINVLIAWDTEKYGNSYYLNVVIYTPQYKRTYSETVKIHKADFEKWLVYLNNYIHFDVYRDRLIHLEHRWEEHGINLTWEDVRREGVKAKEAKQNAGERF